jgi:glycosyltransferase involved in cell wall biosynthesis
MNILFIVPYVPTLVRSRSYNIIRSLSNRGHGVTVLTVWTNERERADLEQLRQEGHRVLAVPMPLWRSFFNCAHAFLGGAPLQSAFSWHPQLIAQAKGAAPFDVVHVEHLRGARYGLQLKEQSRLPIVWDSVDCISHLFRQAAKLSQSHFGRWVTRFELSRTERYESWLPHQFDQVLVTSPVDRQALVSLSGTLNGANTPPSVSVLPNGVDLDYFRPGMNVAREPATLVISGKMSYHANVSMALYTVQSIMPHIWTQRPEVKLYIVGQDPPQEIRALDQHPAVTVTGTVEDMRPYLQQATVAVAAVTYGAGIQNKVLEAMACGTPVVATQSAVSAITAVPDRDLLVATDTESFARAILTLLNNPVQQHAVGTAGRQFVEKHHNWTNIAAHLEQIYDGIIRKNHRCIIKNYVT